MYPWLGAMMTVLALSYSCGADAFNSFSVTTPRHNNDLQRKLFTHRHHQQQHHLATPHHFTTRSRRRIITTPSRLRVSSSKSSDDEPPTQEVEVVTDSLTTSQIKSLKDNQSSFLSNIKRAFTSKKKMDRESLSKMGMSALLAYGFVSNISGVIAVSSAWFIFSKKVRWWILYGPMLWIDVLCEIICLTCTYYISFLFLHDATFDGSYQQNFVTIYIG